MNATCENRSGRQRSAVRITPAEAAAYGAFAGLAATALVSVLARVVPGVRSQAFYKSPDRRRQKIEHESEHPAIVTPAGALAQTRGPGPEGAAGLFGMKVASGLFGRDIARSVRPWGKLVHLAYGSFWGMIYGLSQGRARRNPLASGPAHGFLIWVIGPGFLVPAMKLMQRPGETPVGQKAMNIFGHLLYGVTVGKLFDTH